MRNGIGDPTHGLTDSSYVEFSTFDGFPSEALNSCVSSGIAPIGANPPVMIATIVVIDWMRVMPNMKMGKMLGGIRPSV